MDRLMTSALACFFSSESELIVKVKWLLDKPDIRVCIASAGMERVWRDCHDVTSRAYEFLRHIKL